MATRVWETKSRWQKVSMPQTQVEQMVSQLDNTSACVSCWDHLCLHGGLGTWSLTVLLVPPWAFVSEQPLPHFCSCSILTIRWKGNKQNGKSGKTKQKINRKKWRSGVSLEKQRGSTWREWQDSTSCLSSSGHDITDSIQSVFYLCLCPGT